MLHLYSDASRPAVKSLTCCESDLAGSAGVAEQSGPSAGAERYRTPGYPDSAACSGNAATPEPLAWTLAGSPRPRHWTGLLHPDAADMRPAQALPGPAASAATGRLDQQPAALQPQTGAASAAAHTRQTLAAATRIHMVANPGTAAPAAMGAGLQRALQPTAVAAAAPRARARAPVPSLLQLATRAATGALAAIAAGAELTAETVVGLARWMMEITSAHFRTHAMLSALCRTTRSDVHGAHTIAVMMVLFVFVLMPAHDIPNSPRPSMSSFCY